MENIFIEFLPPWVETGLQPAFYDNESGTVLQQTARMYDKVNEVVASVNQQNEKIAEYIEKFNQLHDYVYTYFDNLDVQNEIDNKLDEMFANGQLDLLFQKYVNDYVETTNVKLDELETKVDSLTDLSPEVVSSTSAMTDHSKIYLNTADGYWYYYNGTQFVQGGLYNSDATNSAIKWYLNDVASDDNNVHNPFTSVVGGLASADGSYIPSSTTTWVTDFIEINPSNVKNVYTSWRFGFILNNNEPLNSYKVCYYDEDKVMTATDSNFRPYIIMSASTYPDISSWKYMRIQFSNTAIPFADRYNVRICFPTGTYDADNGDLYKMSRYTSISTLGIKSAGIENSRLNKNIYLNNIYSMLQHEIMPFSTTDFSYATIDTATGYESYNAKRLCLSQIIKVPAGTTITLSNNWTMLAFKYTDNGTYNGRFYNAWGDSIYFPVEMKIKLIFQNTVLQNINTSDAINNLLSNISVEKGQGFFTYDGEPVILKNKFTAEVVLPTYRSYAQDAACYYNSYITLNSQGYYKVYSMNGDLLKNSTPLDQIATIVPHCNSACFGTEKFDADDHYPLLYVNAYNNEGLPKGACYVYRLLNNMTTSLQQTILIDFTEDPIWAGDGSSVRPYGNFIVDTDNNKLYAYVMIDSLNVTRFFKFNLPELSDGSVIHLTTSDIEDYFDIAWMYYMQGVTYYNGKVYASCGFTSANCKLYVVDLLYKKVTSVLPLGGFIDEPEGVFVYEDELYVSNAREFFKLQF